MLTKYIKFYYLIILIPSILHASECPSIDIQCNMAIIPSSVSKVADLDAAYQSKLKKKLTENDYVVRICLYKPEANCPKCFKELELSKYFPISWFLKLQVDLETEQIKFVPKVGKCLEGATMLFNIKHNCLVLGQTTIKLLAKLNQNDHPQYSQYGNFDKVLNDYLFVEMCFK
ncbi:MAG: hypothetical protein P4L22_06500 [Candidatus Babeliales bacterium]|nr:hypothetical protein [Candidatus Babeliales bacterium]